MVQKPWCALHLWPQKKKSLREFAPLSALFFNAGGKDSSILLSLPKVPSIFSLGLLMPGFLLGKHPSPSGPPHGCPPPHIFFLCRSVWVSPRKQWIALTRPFFPPRPLFSFPFFSSFLEDPFSPEMGPFITIGHFEFFLRGAGLYGPPFAS